MVPSPGNASRKQESVRNAVRALDETSTAAIEPTSTTTSAWMSTAVIVLWLRSVNPNHTTKIRSAIPISCTTTSGSPKGGRRLGLLLGRELFEFLADRGIGLDLLGLLVDLDRLVLLSEEQEDRAFRAKGLGVRRVAGEDELAPLEGHL